MALGGGTWLFQNKKLPGTYINFVSKTRAQTDIADRGYGTMPIELDWGPSGVFAVTAEDFQEKSLALFGYDYANDKLKGLRDLFLNLKTGYFYRLESGAVKASCELGTAIVAGADGNNLSIVVTENNGTFDVVTNLRENGTKTAVDTQSAVTSWEDVTDNDYISFTRPENMTATTAAGVSLTGGIDGPTKAACSIARAKYNGTRGNDLTIAITANVDVEDAFDVATYIDVDGVNNVVDKQQAVKVWDDVKDNDYVDFIRTVPLAATAGTPLSGGSNGAAISALQYQNYIDAIEPYYFNCMGYAGSNKAIQSLLIQFCKRMRDSVGAKFQLVLYGAEGVDYEGVISLKNAVTDAGELPGSLVYWLMGLEASCNINQSCTNRTYSGDFTPDTSYSQSELEKAITDGMIILHNVADSVSGDIVGKVNILTDINTFTSFSKSKNSDFSLNQVIRVLDQSAIDIARLFNRVYLGKEQNDEEGRLALWGDIVALCKEYQRVRAIQNFDADDVPIPTQGEAKTAVVHDFVIQPTCCMEKLYLTVYVA